MENSLFMYHVTGKVCKNISRYQILFYFKLNLNCLWTQNRGLTFKTVRILFLNDFNSLALVKYEKKSHFEKKIFFKCLNWIDNP